MDILCNLQGSFVLQRKTYKLQNNQSFVNLTPGVSHGKVGTHHYFLSWREPWNKFEDWDWFNGRNFCRERCMDLISFDNPGEYKMFEEVMIAGT
jgi:hypothetical protein